jgi:murein DD-endopeptidase MepM/ murein hydrolase activator NlpD
MILSACSLLLLLLVFFPSENASASRQIEQSSLEIGKRYQIKTPELVPLTPDNTPVILPEITPEIALQINSHSKPTTLASGPSLTWQTTRVKSGDSLAKILNRLGYSAKTTYLVSRADGEHSSQLKKLSVGDTLRIGKNNQDQLVALDYKLSKTETLFVRLVDGNYQSNKETKTVEVLEASAHGVIKSNFWHAGIESGLNDAQIINLANLFNWDVDFALDIRRGDSFHVVYENKYIDGEFIGTGKILAAEFVNQDQPFQAIRFTDGEYYTPEGKSTRKAFLRNPVNFKYISSNFNPKRFHPIQKRIKPHRGTDYAAKTGTPVVAAGNGKVVKSAYDKYNGHHVFLEHGNGIETKYIHFSKRAVKKGQRVKQNQVIGYVGSTGMSQAPHLHYEFLLHGVHRNPRTVKLPDAEPINKKYRKEFLQLAQLRLEELADSRQALVAMRNVSSEAP